MEMNRTQQIVVFAVIVIIVFMLLFPPFYLQGEGGATRNCGYQFFSDTLTKFGEGKCRVDVVTLFTQWAGVLIIGALAFFVAKGRAGK